MRRLHSYAPCSTKSNNRNGIGATEHTPPRLFYLQRYNLYPCWRLYRRVVARSVALWSLLRATLWITAICHTAHATDCQPGSSRFWQWVRYQKWLLECHSPAWRKNGNHLMEMPFNQWKECHSYGVFSRIEYYNVFRQIITEKNLVFQESAASAKLTTKWWTSKAGFASLRMQCVNKAMHIMDVYFSRNRHIRPCWLILESTCHNLSRT